MSQQENSADFLGLTNGNRSLPDNFPTHDRFNKLSQKDRFEWSKKFANTFETVPISAALPGGSIQFTNGYTKKKEKFEFGSILSINYSNNYRTNAIDRKSFDGNITQEYTSSEVQYKHLTGLGGIWNVGMKFGQNHKLTILNLFNNNSESMVIERDAVDLTISQGIKQSIQQFQKNTLQSHQVSGESCFGLKCIRFKYQAGVNILRKDVPDLRRTYYSRDFTDPDDTTYRAVALPGVALQTGGRFFSKLVENSYFGGMELAVPFKLFNLDHSIKFGVYEQVKVRSFSTNVLGYVQSGSSNFNYDITKLPASKVYDTSNMNNRGFILKEIYNMFKKLKFS